VPLSSVDASDSPLRETAIKTDVTSVAGFTLDSHRTQWTREDKELDARKTSLPSGKDDSQRRRARHETLELGHCVDF